MSRFTGQSTDHVWRANHNQPTPCTTASKGFRQLMEQACIPSNGGIASGRPALSRTGRIVVERLVLLTGEIRLVATRGAVSRRSTLTQKAPLLTQLTLNGSAVPPARRRRARPPLERAVERPDTGVAQVVRDYLDWCRGQPAQGDLPTALVAQRNKPRPLRGEPALQSTPPDVQVLRDVGHRDGSGRIRHSQMLGYPLRNVCVRWHAASNASSSGSTKRRTPGRAAGIGAVSRSSGINTPDIGASNTGSTPRIAR